MIDRVHTKYGDSFKGCAVYLLHDKDAETRERVAWTATRNMATDNPDAAWRVMAATAMDQDRLKREAGIRPGGKPGKGPVLHLTLSWHAEEEEELSQEEMLRAAAGAIRSIKLEDRQALLVCHTDEPQPHLHIVLNRVSPEDGRLPRDYNDYRKLSRWANKYEQERGKVYCQQRVVNEKARDRGEFVRAEENKPRHLVETEQTVSSEDAKQALREQHRREAHALKQQERVRQQRHQSAWQALLASHEQRQVEIEEQSQREAAAEKLRLRNSYRPRWDALYHQQQAERRLFEQQEQQLFGRVRNALQSIDLRALVSQSHKAVDGRATTISEAFSIISNAGAREEALQRRQKAQDAALQEDQRQHEQAILEAQQRQLQQRLADNRQRFLQQRNDLLLVQSLEHAKAKAQWLEKGRRMREASLRWATMERQQEPDGQNQHAVDRQNDERRGKSQGSTTNTNPNDLLPTAGAEQAAEQIDQYRDRFGRDATRRFDRERDQDARDR